MATNILVHMTLDNTTFNSVIWMFKIRNWRILYFILMTIVRLLSKKGYNTAISISNIWEYPSSYILELGCFFSSKVKSVSGKMNNLWELQKTCFQSGCNFTLDMKQNLNFPEFLWVTMSLKSFHLKSFDNIENFQQHVLLFRSIS